MATYNCAAILRSGREILDRDDPNVRVLCSSCANGEHMCGGDCDCVRCFEDRVRGPQK